MNFVVFHFNFKWIRLDTNQTELVESSWLIRKRTNVAHTGHLNLKRLDQIKSNGLIYHRRTAHVESEMILRIFHLGFNCSSHKLCSSQLFSNLLFRLGFLKWISSHFTVIFEFQRIFFKFHVESQMISTRFSDFFISEYNWKSDFRQKKDSQFQTYPRFPISCLSATYLILPVYMAQFWA